jgi:hypothetical protein
VEREASGDFDYLLDDLADADEAAPVEAGPDGFDAFDSRTWYFEPAPLPWYRAPGVLFALIAVIVAAIALVVAVVLVMFRGPDSGGDETTSVTPTVPTSAAPSPSATSAPPPPPAPPPASSAEPIDPGPAATLRPPPPPRFTKGPEIGVTRTPVTRSPISVSPQRPGHLG